MTAAAPRRGGFSRLWRLVCPYWVTSDEKRIAYPLLAVIVALSLGEVYITVLLNAWNNGFYNALQALDAQAFWRSIGRFCWLAVFFIVIAVYKTYLNQMLQIRWRRWSTRHYLTRWFAGQRHYRMQLQGNPSDNPDQRIAEDVGQFVGLTLGLSLGLLSSAVTLCSFLAILWRLSGDFAFPWRGHPVAVPHAMVWAAIAYAVAGTWITRRIGRPLIRLNFEQQRYEADFRFGLIRQREHSEQIAFYRGEAAEEASSLDRFQSVVGNFRAIMRRQKRLSWFVSGYGQIANVFPFLIAAPAFFAKTIQLGGLMQTVSAFGRVQDALSFIVNTYPLIATWQATGDRLTGFLDSLERASEAGEHALARTADAERFTADLRRIDLPDGRRLLEHVTLSIDAGETWLLTGPSGSGKSTLLRTLAGIWPYAEGRVALPEGKRAVFVPQRPYLPQGSLRAALQYPQPPSLADADLRDALAACRLEHLADRLDDAADWSHILSPGEQQRLAVARLLIAAPDYVFLDEATSALDEVTEGHIYGLLKQRLPAAALISVGHRASLDAWHEHRLEIGANER